MDDRELLIAYFQERDVACPSCYYNLKGNTSGACPECGSVLALKNNIVRIRLRRDKPPARPGDRRHRIALSGLTIPAVLFALLSFGLISAESEAFDATRNGGTPAPDELSPVYWFPIYTGLLVYLTGAIVFGNLKPQFQRRSVRFQRATMLLSWHWLPILIALTAASLL